VKNRFKQGLLVSSIVISSLSNAFAGTVVCGGTVDSLSYHASNKLRIRLSSMNQLVLFCDTDAEWVVPGASHVTSPGACNAMYSTFLSAKLSGASITNMYFDGDDVPTACNAWGSWKTANIRHYVY